MRTLWRYLRSFLMFFGLVAFVVTCSFLLFFSSVELSETDIRAFAPAVFFNVILLSILLFVFDFVRRKLTIERPVKEIQRVLKKLTEGDFEARISRSNLGHKEYGFQDIAASVNALAQELSGVETLRSDFIANVSHELKTPLAVMQNYGTMLQNPDITTEQVLEYSKAISSTSRRLANLVTNILKLNRLENQQIYPDLCEFNLGEQLCECLLQFEEVWEEKQINIITDIEEDVIIRSDTELLCLIWNNLISNALKFTEVGGNVTLKMKREGNAVEVSVSDTGCGMTPDVGAHIFDKFYQGDTSHAGAGNGLGLALVKQVVDIIRGEITVESAPNKGSVFTVRFIGG